MSTRHYEPPQIGNQTPHDVLYREHSADFINILQKRRGDVVRGRSIAIFVDGACANNGTSSARAGMGVYFGPGSRYNMSERLWHGEQTNQRAEIRAACLALEKVQRLLERGDLSTKTVVLVSDSAYVVKSMTEWIYRWLDNSWTNSKGWEVANRDDFEALDNLIDRLEDDYGVYVRFWQVGRGYNQGADVLAKDALADDEDDYY